MAVNIADKMANPVWRILDERTINARLATLLANSKRALNVIKSGFSKQFRLQTNHKETGNVWYFSDFGIGENLWGLNTSIDPSRKYAPVGVEAADGWMATLDDRGVVVIDCS